MPDIDNTLIAILREELGKMAVLVQQLSNGLARVEEKVKHNEKIVDDLAEVRTSVEKIDRQLVKVSGVNGDNGQLSELVSRVEKMSEDLQDLSLLSKLPKKVEENTKNLQSLLMSRAAMAGYAAAAGGSSAAIMKFLV